MAVLNFLADVISYTLAVLSVMAGVTAIVVLWTVLISSPEARKRRIDKWNGKR